MRFDRAARARRRAWSKAAHAAKARRRLELPAPDYAVRPEPGRLLHTIRVESHVAGIGFELVVRQARRLNQVTVHCFGRASRPHGVDWLVRHLRARLVTRWLTSP